MTVVWEINIGNVMTLLAFGVGVIGLYYALKSDVRSLSEALAVLGGRMINVENNLSRVNETLAQVARQDERLIAQDARITQLMAQSAEWRTYVRDELAALNRKIDEEDGRRGRRS